MITENFAATNHPKPWDDYYSVLHMKLVQKSPSSKSVTYENVWFISPYIHISVLQVQCWNHEIWGHSLTKELDIFNPTHCTVRIYFQPLLFISSVSSKPGLSLPPNLIVNKRENSAEVRPRDNLVNRGSPKAINNEIKAIKHLSSVQVNTSAIQVGLFCQVFEGKETVTALSCMP